MGSLLEVDWELLFVPSGSLVEIVLRGSAIYLALFLLLRVLLKRETGMVSTTDLLVVVLIADAAQNGMAGEYKSITEGIVLVLTIIGWSYSIDWLAYHLPFLEKLFKPQPLPLVKEGKLLRRNMRRELITRQELLGSLREQGIDDLDQVKVAYMETDGLISVIRKDGGTPQNAKHKNAA